MAKLVEVRAQRDFDKIVLELDYEEAVALKHVLNAVGGDPKESQRKYIDNIYRVLADLKLAPAGGNHPLIGTIQFKTGAF